jgi:hypothetical protein
MSESLFQRSDCQAKIADLVPQSCPLFASTPYLYDCLKTTYGKENKVIKGCTLRLGFYGADVQVLVTDEHNHKYAFLTLDPFKTLPEALEEVLSSGSLNWRDSRSKR